VDIRLRAGDHEAELLLFATNLEWFAVKSSDRDSSRPIGR